MTTDSTPTYAPGTPLYVDLGSSDLAASTKFYSQLFGWQPEDQGEQMGHYTQFKQGGKVVAGAGPLMMPQQPVAWSTYIYVTDAADTAKKVRDAGGTVYMEPMDVMDLGRMAVFGDPAGAAFGIWQPGTFKGVEVTNTPNSLCWNELATRDLEGAKTFYPRVFGWAVQSSSMPGMGEYVEWQVGGRSIAGALAMGDHFPAQVPPHWLVYFNVADTDATVSKAQSLGGQLVAGPTDIPQGRFAVLADPQRAPFAIIKTPS